MRSITERIKGKEGRIRGNLMGKRVDFSARSVITPDASISIDEFGVPLKIAMNLTYPEIVSERNIEKLEKYVENGPNNYPGAKFVKKINENGRIIRLKSKSNEISEENSEEISNETNNIKIKLEIGDTVDRHLINGDWVLCNRQPSLHRMSMQGHRIRVMPFETFRLNASVTPSYNADFDGDTKNKIF